MKMIQYCKASFVKEKKKILIRAGGRNTEHAGNESR